MWRLFYVLDSLDEDDAAPAGPWGGPPAQTHLHEELDKLDDLETAGSPSVGWLLLRPRSREACMGRGGQDGLIPRVGLNDAGEDGIVIDTRDIEQGRYCMDAGSRQTSSGQTQGGE